MVVCCTLTTDQHPIGITHQLWFLLAIHHPSLPANIINKIRLHLTQSDLPVPICISITFHAFHQVVAENSVLEIWVGNWNLTAINPTKIFSFASVT